MGGHPDTMRPASRFLNPDQMIILAPPLTDPPANFEGFEVDRVRHMRFLGEAQRLRGRVYVQDGAIGLQQLTADGRFVQSHDEQSWQFLVMNAEGIVSGCARFTPKNHDVVFSDFGVARSALAHCPSWGNHLRRAVEAKRAEAKKRGLAYGELGGWALSDEIRHSREALRISLNVWGLMKLLGGALAITMATRRHRSSEILRKLGGHRLYSGGIELPSYYDSQYECEMEILGFDSDNPNPKYEMWIQECQRKVRSLTVICSEPLCENWETPHGDFEMECVS